MKVEAENSAVLDKSLREFADQMQLLSLRDKVELPLVAALISAHFEQNYANTKCKGAILVDNFESSGPQSLKWGDVLQCLPKEGVDLIVTSRGGDIPVVSIQMPKLDRKDSKQLLMNMLRQSDESALDEAAQFCCDCPLALTLFAGFVMGYAQWVVAYKTCESGEGRLSVEGWLPLVARRSQHHFLMDILIHWEFGSISFRKCTLTRNKQLSMS